MTIRQERHRKVTNTLNHTVAQREECIARLVRLEARLTGLRKQKARLEKAMAKPDPVETPAPKVSDVTDISWAEMTGADIERKPLTPEQVEVAKSTHAEIVDGFNIPDFLNRSRSAQERDRLAREEIEREQAERKRLKAKAQAETRKAKLSGETRRMPLTGRAALEAIRRG